MAGLLFDTDVLIDFLRGRPEAIAFVDSLEDRPRVSAITLGELYAGVREGRERVELDRFVSGLLVVEIIAPIAVEGGLLRRQYGASHGVGFNDAFIAATARSLGASLVTLNAKHFPMLPDVLVPYRKS